MTLKNDSQMCNLNAVGIGGWVEELTLLDFWFDDPLE